MIEVLDHGNNFDDKTNFYDSYECLRRLQLSLLAVMSHHKFQQSISSSLLTEQVKVTHEISALIEQIWNIASNVD
jgi:hypothetical protein